MADPTFGSKSGAQNGAQAKTWKKEWKCDPILDPILGSIFGPKNGVSHRRISLLPAHVVQADLRPCSLNMNVNSYLFLFVRPKSDCYCMYRSLCQFNFCAPLWLDFFFPPVWPMSLSGSVLTWEEASSKENSAPNTVVSAEWQFHTRQNITKPAMTRKSLWPGFVHEFDQCSLRHAIERVERPGESQLALDGEKKSDETPRTGSFGLCSCSSLLRGFH